VSIPKYKAALDPEKEVTNASRHYVYDGRPFRDSSSRGHSGNPCHVEPQGTAWDPETGYGGQAAAPPVPIAEQRINARIAKWREDNFDLAGNEAVENVIAQHVVNRQTEGWEFEAAVKDATATVRMLIPRPTVSREVWTAQAEAERLAADRRRHGMQIGEVTAKRIDNR
jgi:hypothetical protein